MISKSFKICNSLLGSGSVQLETNSGRKGKVSKMDRAALGTKCDPLPGGNKNHSFSGQERRTNMAPTGLIIKEGTWPRAEGDVEACPFIDRTIIPT